MMNVIAVGLSPTIQKTIAFTEVTKDSVNRSTGYRLDASGKAFNSARVLHQLSPGSVTAICPLGGENAQVFLDLALSDGMKIDWIPLPGRVRYCYTLLEPGTGCATELVVSEPVARDAGAKADFIHASERLLERIGERLSGSDALLIAGSRPSSFPEDLTLRICQMAQDSGTPVVVDFWGKDLNAVLSKVIPSIIKINEEEFCRTFGIEYPVAGETLSAAVSERSAALENVIIVTRGSRDTFAANCGVSYRQAVQKVTAVNAIGCGDSFTAGFLHSWLTEKDMRLALDKGTECACRNALNFRPGSILDGTLESEQLWQ